MTEHQSMYERVRDEQEWDISEGQCENARCLREARQGRPVHVIMRQDVRYDELIVMPSYHFATAEEGKKAWTLALLTAPTIKDDADLYAARINQTPHKLPLGWVDPSRR